MPVALVHVSHNWHQVAICHIGGCDTRELWCLLSCDLSVLCHLWTFLVSEGLMTFFFKFSHGLAHEGLQMPLRLRHMLPALRCYCISYGCGVCVCVQSFRPRQHAKIRMAACTSKHRSATCHCSQSSQPCHTSRPAHTWRQTPCRCLVDMQLSSARHRPVVQCLW